MKKFSLGHLKGLYTSLLECSTDSFIVSNRKFLSVKEKIYIEILKFSVEPSRPHQLNYNGFKLSYPLVLIQEFNTIERQWKTTWLPIPGQMNNQRPGSIKNVAYTLLRHNLLALACLFFVHQLFIKWADKQKKGSQLSLFTNSDWVKLSVLPIHMDLYTPLYEQLSPLSYDMFKNI